MRRSWTKSCKNEWFSSRGQRRPRGVKRKMSNSPLRPGEGCCGVGTEFSKCIRIVK